MPPTELVISMELWPRPLNWLSRSIGFSSLRPTKDEVADLNRTAGAIMPTLVEDRGLGERLLKHYLAAGVDINAADLRQFPHWTALHLAALNNDEDGVRMLLAHGADPNQRDANGRTPADLLRMDPARTSSMDYSAVIKLLDAAEAKR